MGHAQIAGVEPAACKGFISGFWVLQIALHDDISLEHDLADGLAVMGAFLHRVRVEYAGVLFQHIRHALTGFEIGLRFNRRGIPVLVPCAGHGGAVNLGQAVDMGDVKALLLHSGERRSRGRGGGGHEADLMVEGAPLGIVGIDNKGHHNWCAAQMGDAVIGDGVENHICRDCPCADTHAGFGGNRPWEAPAVAMEHRERPQVTRMHAQVPFHRVGDRVYVSAAMMVDDAFGLAGRT